VPAPPGGDDADAVPAFAFADLWDAFAALSHVGAGTIAVPVGLSAAGIAAFRLRWLGWPVLRHGLLPVIIALAGIGLYWLLVLLPAGRDYVTNPASLGYRRPARLLKRQGQHIA